MEGIFNWNMGCPFMTIVRKHERNIEKKGGSDLGATNLRLECYRLPFIIVLHVRKHRISEKISPRSVRGCKERKAHAHY